jgi:hypothetical protein
MKRTALIIMALLALGLAAPAVAAHDNDFQSIQKAVKKNPAYREGKEVRWFKVEIMDGHSRANKLKITLPIALIELVLSCSDTRHVRLDDGDCEVDLKALWKELKKAGPMALIEIRDDDALIKVWLE